MYILDVVSVFLIKTCELINIVFYQVASHLKSRRTYKTICLEAKDNPSPPGHSSDDISIFFAHNRIILYSGQSYIYYSPFVLHNAKWPQPAVIVEVKGKICEKDNY